MLSFTDWLGKALKKLPVHVPFCQERLRALDKLQDEAFIAKQKEYYKYITFRTLLERLTAQAYHIPVVDVTHSFTAVPTTLASSVTLTLTFINGVWSQEQSSIDESIIRLRKLSDLPVLEQIELVNRYKKTILAHEDFFATLSLLLAQESYLIEVASELLFEPILTIQHLVTESVLHLMPHLLLAVGKASKVVVLEAWHASMVDKEHFINNVTYLSLERNAKVDYYKLYTDYPHFYQVNTLYCTQSDHSSFTHHTFAFGAVTLRFNLTVQVEGSHAMTDLYGLSVLGEAEQVDYRIQVVHSCPSSRSNQYYKSILGGTAVDAFHGKIYLTEAAQQTNAYQTNHAILLSSGAQHYVQPQLEIYADDVKCSHGAAVGQLDYQQLFYLQSRGIEASLAKQMLLESFGNTVVEVIPMPALRKHIGTKFLAKLIKL